MRILFRYTENKIPVPIINQDYINGYIHKCLGENNEFHDKQSDYCVSGLYGGKLNIKEKTLSFRNGGYICVTSDNMVFLNRLIKGIRENPDLKWGMKFKTTDFIVEEFYENIPGQNYWHHFATLSPFIIKESVNKKEYNFVTLKDEYFSEKVKFHLIEKLMAIDPSLNIDGFDVKIENRETNKVKEILLGNVKNEANQCQVSIFCSLKVAKKIYTMGLGQSTGAGFGTIYKTENHHKYKMNQKNE